MDYIIIDRQKLKALLSETRIEILKHLAKRRYTLSELAELLDTTKSNIADHLYKLEKAELIEQIDEGRKWKYYKLTVQGRELIEGRSIAKPIAIILVTVIVMIGIALNIMFTVSESTRLAATQQIDSELTFIPRFEIIAMLVVETILGIILILGIIETLRARGKL